MASLVYQLLKQSPTARRLVLEQYDRSDDNVFEDANGWDALCTILDDVLEETKSNTTWLLVDALDECAQGLQNLLELVATLLRHNVRIVVSSRNIPRIETGLRQSQVHDSLRLELNTEAISRAVALYIEAKVDQLTTAKQLDDSERQEIFVYLQSNAEDTFLWVSLVYQELRNDEISRWNILDHLREFPPTLDEVYQRIARTLNEYDDAKQQRLREILALVCLAYRPLQLTELPSVVSAPDRVAAEIDFWRHEVESCGGFLAIQEGVIFFVHQTSQRFVQKQFGTSFLPVSIGAAHMKIVQRAVAALSGALREDIYDLKRPGISISEVDHPPENPLGPIKYACVHWADHVSSITRDVADLNIWQQIKRFLSKHFFHWLGASSLLKVTPVVIVSLTKLIRAVEETFAGQNQSTTGEILTLFRTALRITRYFVDCIVEYPIQIYACAPVFTPPGYLELFSISSNSPWWMANLPEDSRVTSWGECIQTIPTNYIVECSALSPCGTQIACGDTMGCIRVWDILTGQMLISHSCKKHPPGSMCRYNHKTIAIAFSYAGGPLAFLTKTPSLYIYDVEMNKCQEVYHDGELDPRETCMLAFACDGLRLVVAFTNTKYIIEWVAKEASLNRWAMATRSARQFGPSSSVLIALSPTADLAAYNVALNHIELWSTLSGNCLLKIPYVGNAAAFSADSTMFAASTRHYVRLWDLRSNTAIHKRTLVHTGLDPDWRDLRIAISSNGRHLALSYGFRGTFISTDDDCQQFKSLVDPPKDLYFTDEGKTLITTQVASIKIWEPQLARDDDQNNTIKGPSKIIAVSPDHLHLVTWGLSMSKSLGRDLHVRKTTSGQRLITMRDTWVPGKVVFALNKTPPMMISISRFGHVEICDLATGSCRRPLPVELNRGVHHLAVSPDGARVGVLSSGELTLRHLEANLELSQHEGKEVLSLLRETAKGLGAMAFGPRGQIAVVTGRGTVKIWKGGEQWRSLPDIEDGEYLDLLLERDACIAFSPCGSEVATGTRLFSPLVGGFMWLLKIWDIESDTCVNVSTQSLYLPMAFSWIGAACKCCGGAGTAVFRNNCQTLEIAMSTNPRGLDLCCSRQRPEWVCLKKEPALWLPAERRGPALDDGTPMYGWAGPMMYLPNDSNELMRISLSEEYLSGQNDLL